MASSNPNAQDIRVGQLNSVMNVEQLWECGRSATIVNLSKFIQNQQVLFLVNLYSRVVLDTKYAISTKC